MSFSCALRRLTFGPMLTNYQKLIRKKQNFILKIDDILKTRLRTDIETKHSIPYYSNECLKNIYIKECLKLIQTINH
jgi:hypothetical protein